MENAAGLTGIEREWTRVGRGISWGRRRAIAATIAMALTLLGAVTAPLARATDPAPAATLDVIIRRDEAAGIDLEALVRSAGGTVHQALPVIEGVAATVPAAQVAFLEAQPGVVEVTEDRALTLDTPSSTSGWASASAAFDFVEQDFGSSHGGSSFSALTTDNLAEVTGADKAWSTATGQGIDVALIDSGVVPVPGMGTVVNGPDLSFESPAPELRHLDTFGHGTHLAGIINGNGEGIRGLAPDARLVNVKVAASNGAADVSQVIAAIDWVVQHRDRDGLNIRVLALAFGTDSVQPYDLDPLAYAAEVAWRKGIVVVVSAGNQGASAPSLTNPARDPFVIAVGASEPHGTFTTGDDTVAEFSNRGNPARGVDLVAPGRSLVSLRAPGSFVDQQHPEGRVGDRFFRGSGTSQSAAVVAAAAALVLEEHPSYTPDDVKWTLEKTAKALPMADAQAEGAGTVDLRKAVTYAIPGGVDTTQHWTPSTGTGSLDGARGTYRLSRDGVVLDGERDIFGTPWEGVSWSGVSWSGVSWSGVSWSGVSWSGVSWSGVSWSGVSWSGVSWSGVSWSGVSWSTHSSV